MEASTAPSPSYTPRALDAKTVAEAFQLTAEDHADQPAIRTKGGEYRAPGRSTRSAWRRWPPASRASASVVATPSRSCSRTGPSSIRWTPRRCTSARRPFSIYNTYTPDQIKYLIGDAATKVLVTEQAFLDTVLKAKEGSDALEHVVVSTATLRTAA